MYLDDICNGTTERPFGTSGYADAIIPL